MIGCKFTYDGISCDEYGVFAGEFEQATTGKTYNDMINMVFESL